MQKLPPIAPVTAKGPLGVVHLPRMWAKALQHATGYLQDDYIVGCGLDRGVMGALGIDADKAIAFIESERPTYLEFENWIVGEAGGSLSEEKIRAANEAILGRRFDPEHAREFREEIGLSDESGIDSAALLDTFDDWVQFHKLMTSDVTASAGGA